MPKPMPVYLLTWQKLAFLPFYQEILQYLSKTQMPFFMNGHSQPLENKVATQLISLLITSSIGSGRGEFFFSFLIHKIHSLQVADTLNTITQTLSDFQGQKDSVASVVLQNERVWDILTAAQGKSVLCLRKTVILRVNKSGQFQNNIH
jgi:hypothetical protein